MKNILRNSNFGLTKWCVALIAAGWMGVGTGWGATAYQMSSGDKTWNFSDIANWSDDFASGVDAVNWGSVAVIGTGTAVDTGLRTTKSSAKFVTGVSGGLQKGTQAMVFLSTGSGATPEAVAADLFLDFTGRTAGTLSFDWAALDNSSGARPTSLRVFWSTEGTTFTELTGARLLDKESATAPASGSVSSIALPTQFSGSSTARLRFYNHAGAVTGSGNRDKFQIDNVAVTSITAGTNPEVTSFSPTVGKTGSSVTITGANFGSSTPVVSFNGIASTVTSSTTTSIVANVPVGATSGKISVTVGGSTAESSADFVVDNIAPLVSTYSPADNASSAPTSSFKITFNENIAKGSGNIVIKKASDNSVVETIVVSASQISISGAILSIKPTTSLAYLTEYYIEYSSGIVTDLAGNSLLGGLSGATVWNFTTKAESPVIITQYYEGLSNNKFIEIANLGESSITLTGYSLVLWSNSDAEGWKNTNTYTATYILDLSTVTLTPGQVYVIANSGALSPIAAASANTTSSITFFGGNDSVVLHYLGDGLTINDPASVVDVVSFTNTGNEGADKSFVRISKALGYSFDAGSNITQFTDVWQSVSLATANAAASGTDNYLGYSSLAAPPVEGSTFAGAYPGKNMTDVAPNGLTYLANYGFGGSESIAPTLPIMDSSDSTKLKLIVVVRTDDSIILGGETTADLAAGWSTSGVTVDPSTDASPVPAHTARKVISVDRSGSKRFLRATITR